VFFRIFILCSLFLSSLWACAQVVPDARAGISRIKVGGYYSYYDTGYSGYRMTGPAAFIDWSSSAFWHIGAEAEGRWLISDAPNNFSEYTYLAGPRYRFPVGKRAQPYAKVLLGAGEINFPYHLAHGGYFAIAVGGGVDLAMRRRWGLRVDYEYQIWPDAVGIPGIPSSALKPNGVSAGISYRVF
jgi:opacity protein-like surface antigen